MGWPNADPEGWDVVCRDAAEAWLVDEVVAFHALTEPPKRGYHLLLEMLQAEHPDVFDKILMRAPMSYIGGATNDYFMARFGGES